MRGAAEMFSIASPRDTPDVAVNATERAKQSANAKNGQDGGLGHEDVGDVPDDDEKRNGGGALQDGRWRRFRCCPVSRLTASRRPRDSVDYLLGSKIKVLEMTKPLCEPSWRWVCRLEWCENNTRLEIA